ncbi:nitrate reductase NapE component [Staphylococcus saprophyticus]|jgi:hypothetical protein
MDIDFSLVLQVVLFIITIGLLGCYIYSMFILKRTNIIMFLILVILLVLQIVIY